MLLRVMPSVRIGGPISNPYISQLYDSLAAAGVVIVPWSRPRFLRMQLDVWHLHWPENAASRASFARAALKCGEMLLWCFVAKLRGTGVVWTVHNLRSHEQPHPRLERWYMSTIARLVDGSIHLTEAGRALAMGAYPRLRAKPSFVVPHGHYRDHYPRTLPRSAARAQLKIADDARVLLCLGSIRRYKNVTAVVTAFTQLGDDDVHLVIAGQPFDRALEREVRDAANGVAHVILHLDYVPESDLQAYFGAADLMVLPFTENLNSGSALLALSFGVPVLVPDTAVLRELRRQVGDTWVRTFDGTLTASVLEDALARTAALSASDAPDLSDHEWPAIAAATRAAFLRVMRPHESPKHAVA
jgi:beta-1,4-mannosyltransferase